MRQSFFARTRAPHIAVSRSCVRSCALALTVGLAAGLTAVGGVHAQQPSEADIIKALKPAPSHGLTRSLAPQPAAQGPAPAQRALIDNLRSLPATRAITIEERAQVAEIAKARPQIDLEINFEYDSAKVGPSSAGALVALGRALSSDQLKGTVFLINGHTDAAGGAEYNQDLSQRRADAVKRLLIEQFNMPPNTMIAVGFGKSQLKNPNNPLGGENRRVQIVNTEVK